MAMIVLLSNRLLKNAHLPSDRLMALSNVEGRRCPHPSSPRGTGLYVSLLGISGAFYPGVFEQPAIRAFFSNLLDKPGRVWDSMKQYY
jgi:hypothetical protein